jgi:hypothetical protein
MAMSNGGLWSAGIGDGLAALGHLACIAGGPKWYRRFGAGARMEREAAAGLWRPTLITLGIAAVLSVWAAYAITAAIGNRLPMTRWILGGIAAVYLVRGVGGIPLMQLGLGRSRSFWMWSSAICLALAALHGIGLFTAWHVLA